MACRGIPYDSLGTFLYTTVHHETYNISFLQGAVSEVVYVNSDIVYNLTEVLKRSYEKNRWDMGHTPCENKVSIGLMKPTFANLVRMTCSYDNQEISLPKEGCFPSRDVRLRKVELVANNYTLVEWAANPDHCARMGHFGLEEENIWCPAWSGDHLGAGQKEDGAVGKNLATSDAFGEKRPST